MSAPPPKQAPATESTTHPAAKRKVLMVDRNLQRRLLAKTGILICLLFAAFYVLNSLFASKALAELQSGAGSDPAAVLARYQAFMNLAGLVLSCFGLGLVYTIGLRITHRIAGPIYASIKYLEDYARGKTDKELKFRDKDYFPELAQAINQVLQGLKKK